MAASAFARKGWLLRQVQPVALAEVAHCIEWCVIQHNHASAVFDCAALRVRVARVFVQRVAVAQQCALWAVLVGYVVSCDVGRVSGYVPWGGCFEGRAGRYPLRYG